MNRKDISITIRSLKDSDGSYLEEYSGDYRVKCLINLEEGHGRPTDYVIDGIRERVMHAIFREVMDKLTAMEDAARKIEALSRQLPGPHLSSHSLVKHAYLTEEIEKLMAMIRETKDACS